MKIPFALTAVVLAAVVGCASSASKEPIPRRGEVVTQGIGSLSFRAPGTGLLSVYDVNTNSVIHSSAVREGSVVAINPKVGNITVTDGDRAASQIVHTGLSRSHKYEMWFIATRPGDARALEPTTRWNTR